MAGWSTSSPADSDFQKDFPLVNRTDKATLQTQLQVEHDVLTAGGAEATLGRHKFPRGATGSRPASPATGSIYFNTTIGAQEIYDGSNWQLAQTQIVIELTNKTGGALVAGDVVALKQSTDASAVELKDTVSSESMFVVALDSISNNASGRFAIGGRVTVRNQGAVTQGNFVRKSATTLAIEDTGTACNGSNDVPVGTIGIALAAAGGTGTLVIYKFPNPYISPFDITADQTSVGSLTLAAGKRIVPAAVSGSPAAGALYSDNVPKAWVQFNGTGSIAITDSFNVSGLVDNGTGDYTITIDTDFATANYVALGGMRVLASTVECFSRDTTVAKAAGSCRMKNARTDLPLTLVDADELFAFFIGKQ